MNNNRRARASGKRSHMAATKAPAGITARVSAELRDTIAALMASSRRKSSLTLHDVRLALQGDTSEWEQEGELIHPQDRTALLIEIDDLIEKHGTQALACGFLPAVPG